MSKKKKTKLVDIVDRGNHSDDRVVEEKNSKVQVVEFKPKQRYLDRRKVTPLTTETQPPSQILQTKPLPSAGLNQLRHEVKLFGIRGFDKSSKEEKMEKVLIKLGAKPPKNEYVNYKKLIEKRKEQQKTRMEKREMDKAEGFNVGKTPTQLKKKKQFTPNAVPLHSGMLGRYHEGVQVINKKHLWKFSNRRQSR